MRTTARRALARGIGITSVCAVSGFLAVPAAYASASHPASTQTAPVSQQVISSSLDWGVKSSFHDYLLSPDVRGGWVTSESVSEDEGVFSWTEATGEAYADEGYGLIYFTGGVHYTGLYGHFAEGQPAIDIVLENPVVEFSTEGELTTGILWADVESLTLQQESVGGAEIPFAELTFPEGISFEEEAVSVVAEAALTSQGAEAFGGYYEEGEVLDPVSLSADLEPRPAQASGETSESVQPAESGDNPDDGLVDNTDDDEQQEPSQGPGEDEAADEETAPDERTGNSENTEPGSTEPENTGPQKSEPESTDPDDTEPSTSEETSKDASEDSAPAEDTTSDDAERDEAAQDKTPVAQDPAGNTLPPAAPSQDDLTEDTKGKINAPNSAELGQRVVVEVGKEFAGEEIAAIMFSDPTPLGTLQVSPAGTVTVTIPNDPSLPGEHRLASYNTDGEVIGWSPTTVLDSAARSAERLTPFVSPLSSSAVNSTSAAGSSSAAGSGQSGTASTAGGSSTGSAAPATSPSANSPARSSVARSVTPASPLDDVQNAEDTSAGGENDEGAEGVAPGAQEVCDTSAVSNATLGWGLRESFRSYIQGGIANGDWSLNGIEYGGGQFVWSGGSGEFDPNAGTGSVSFSGNVHFTGHDGVLDMTLADPTIQVNGADSAVMIANVVSSDMDGNRIDMPGVTFAEISGPVSASGDSVDISGAQVNLTADGAEAFAGFYEPGEPLDPLDLSVSLSGECGTAPGGGSEGPVAGGPGGPGESGPGDNLALTGGNISVVGAASALLLGIGAVFMALRRKQAGMSTQNNS